MPVNPLAGSSAFRPCWILPTMDVMQTADLFADLEAPGPVRETMGEGAVLLRGKALPLEDELITALAALAERSSFRRMTTPGGFVMSVAMTNCGAAGWVTDRTGYRYDRNDPETGQAWPDMPGAFLRLAAEAAAEAGYQDFAPDACLINRYEPGARLSLHQDRNERDFAEPIVSVSLGLPAETETIDRKSTRLNSSHVAISYAV